MINILLIDDNLHYSKNLINYISKQCDEIRLYKILTNGKDALNTIENESEKIDIILLDLKLPSITGINIINKLEEDNFTKFYDSIIVISGESTMIREIMDNKYIHTYINKLEGFEKIVKEINLLCKIKEKQKIPIEKKIDLELEHLHYNNKLIGTKYIREALLLIASNESLHTKDLKNNVYKIIAKKYSKNVNNIKCNINNATEMMNCDCKKEVLMQYFRNYDYSMVVTPKQVIDEILIKIAK